MTRRQDRVALLLQELAASFISEHSNKTSLITVTHVDVSADLFNATVYLTVLPETQEQAVIDFTNRRRIDFRNSIKGKTNLKRIPHFAFELDEGERNRQRIDELSRQ